MKRQTRRSGSITAYTIVANAVSTTSSASRLSRAIVEDGFMRSSENARSAFRSCAIVAAA